MDKTKLDLRPVMASNLEDAMDRKESINSQWAMSGLNKNRIAYKLYYYMLSLSAYDHETHNAYLSDRKWTKKKASEKIKCDPRSITNNLNSLMELGVIIRDNRRKAFIFPNPNYEAFINYNTLGVLLDLDGLIDSVEATRILSVISYAYYNNVRTFCGADIKYAIGRPNLNVEFIRILMSWWHSLGIIEYSEKIVNKGFCNYTEYEITYLNTARAITLDENGRISTQYEQLFEQC